MSGFKGVMKEGWHPKGKEGGKESWRGDFKGINQVAGWMGKGKDPHAEAASSHVSRPLTELKDPSSFGPPPKHINYHGGIAAPDRITPDTRGLGAPLPPPQVGASHYQQQAQAQPQEAEVQRPPPPPAPYRSNTTGLTVNHLPPPPVRRDISRGSSPAPPPPSTAGKPNLPPRLPPRNPSQNSPNPSPPPPSYETSEGQVNRGAISRLGQAGVNVPAFGIGSSNPWKNESSQTSSSATRSPIQSPPMNELQSRFSKLSTGKASPTSPQPPPSEGTTFAQKQAAFKTAQSFHKDPSSVSLSDARTAASTANNFRERHGEQVSSGVKTANGINQKYGIAGKLNGFAAGNGIGTASREASPAPPAAAASSANPALRKPPPPPPPKRMESSSSLNRQPPPPPLPLGTKPR